MMMKKTTMSHRCLVLALISCGCLSLDAFQIPNTQPTAAATTTTQLHLVPAQGQQLVAAAAAASVSPKDKKKDVTLNTADESSISVLAKTATKAFVSRIFSIPGAIMGRHPAAAPALVDLPREEIAARQSHDDVVLYPIVGFQFVNGKALPTKTNAACRLNHMPDQEVYGWYTTACRLDSIYSDTYCDEPAAKIITDNNND